MAMASLSFDEKNNRYRIRFQAFDESVRCISLSQRANEKRKGLDKRANSMLNHIEGLIESRASGQALTPAQLKWLNGLKPAQRKTLLNAGMIISDSSGKPKSLGAFLESWMSDRADQKKSTLLVWGHAKRNLNDFFGSDKLLSEVTEEDAKRFERWLVNDQNLAESTVRKRCGFSKQMFQTAVDDRIIEANPLQKLKVAAVGNPDTQYFVTEGESQKVLAACPSAEWKACFVLARWAALRIPSEIQSLRWSDIHWEQNRFHVHATKTEHHSDKGNRVVPLFPEVRAALNELWDTLEGDPAEYVLPHIRTITNVNPQLGRIIKNAGLTVWPKRWQNLRATRATELERKFPSHVVTGWCGHTERIAAEHYWMTTEEDFQRAACPDLVPPLSMQATKDGCNGLQADLPAQEKSPENIGFQGFAEVCVDSDWRITDLNR